MGETALGRVQVADATQVVASGSGSMDGNQITVQLGQNVPVSRGGYYTLTAGANRWKCMCTDSDSSGFYHFNVT